MAEKNRGFLREVFDVFLGIAVVIGAVALLGAGIEHLKS